MTGRKLIMIILLCVLNSCKSDDQIVVSTFTSDKSIVYTIELQNSRVEVVVDSLGRMTGVVNYIDGHKQIVSYHLGSQLVAAKVIQDNNNLQQGVAYFFNEENERLHSVSKYMNDTQVGSGFSFYDGMNAVKDYVEYDSVGQTIFHRRYLPNGRIDTTIKNY